ncbi:MAG: zinc-ribbon domain-containing protein [Candidatus Hodarchaeales archaeon]
MPIAQMMNFNWVFFGLGLGFLALAGGILFQLFLAYIIYKDALKNDPKNATLWGVVVFFAGVIGIIIYLVSKPKDGKSYQPRSRSSTYTPSGKGQATSVFCTSCGVKVDADSKFCPNCGTITGF